MNEHDREALLTCVFDGRRHTSKYAACRSCRSTRGREEDAAHLRRVTLGRDQFLCRWCGSDGDHNLVVAHAVPAVRRGTGRDAVFVSPGLSAPHVPWNLATLCAWCNDMRPRRWDPQVILYVLMAAYMTELRSYLSQGERTDLARDVAEWRRRHVPVLQQRGHSTLPYDVGGGETFDVCRCGWSGSARTADEPAQACPRGAVTSRTRPVGSPYRQ